MVHNRPVDVSPKGVYGAWWSVRQTGVFRLCWWTLCRSPVTPTDRLQTCHARRGRHWHGSVAALRCQGQQGARTSSQSPGGVRLGPLSHAQGTSARAVSQTRMGLLRSAPAAALSLWRYEDHQTGGRLADLLRRPAERNIQQASFTMTAQD